MCTTDRQKSWVSGCSFALSRAQCSSSARVSNFGISRYPSNYCTVLWWRRTITNAQMNVQCTMIKRSLDDIIRSFDAWCEILKRCLTKAAKKQNKKRNKQKNRREKLKSPVMKLVMMKMMMIWIIVMVCKTYWSYVFSIRTWDKESQQHSKWNMDKEYG